MRQMKMNREKEVCRSRGMFISLPDSIWGRICSKYSLAAVHELNGPILGDKKIVTSGKSL